MKSLKDQLEATRFERAREIAESLAEHRALLTTAELARINGIITGKSSASGDRPGERQGERPGVDPRIWRHETTTITLPGGRKETLALIVDPVLTAREKLHRATELAESGSPLDAGVEVYIGLVLAHVFLDANRRTAALAAHYFFRRYGLPLSGVEIHSLELGDLREPKQVEELRNNVLKMVQKLAQK